MPKINLQFSHRNIEFSAQVLIKFSQYDEKTLVFAVFTIKFDTYKV